MIVHDNSPLGTPEKDELKLFSYKLNPLYKLPCEQTCTDALAKKIHKS